MAVTAVVISLAALSCGSLTEDSGTRVDPVDQGAKVTICHIPPGNPANAHTITVGASAVPAHLRLHGDSLGACPDGGGGDGGDGGGGDDDDDHDGGGDDDHDGGGCGGGGGGEGGDDGGDPGQCLPIDAACTTSAACCDGLDCVDAQLNPCAGGGACTCQVVIN